jgi:ATP-dependent DNA ligase
MEAKLSESLPEDGAWQFEPKWDGFRCLVFRDGDNVDLRAKSGKPLGRFFPEVVAHVAALAPSRFVLDGELLIAQDGSLSFDALQMRLHPAESRIAKLSRETPAQLVLFDMLQAPGGADLMEAPLPDRRAALEAFYSEIAPADGFLLSPETKDRSVAEGWLKEAGEGALDGVIAKPLDGAYAPGERAMVKVKPQRTADCVVGGFRYGKDSDLVGALLLGLYNDEGKLDHVGFTSTLRNAEKPELTRRLEALEEAPGFTGNAPGGPSRWSTERSSQWVPLKPELVVEVRYDQITARRFRHGTKLIRFRPDKAASQCTFEQIAPVAAGGAARWLSGEGAK